MVPCVIVIKNGVVFENILCEDQEHVYKVFLNKCEDSVSNWDDYTYDDKETVLEDGFCMKGNGSICISWAMTPKEQGIE